MSNSYYPLVIIGAGAAGLGASEKASAAGIEHVVLEASHRTGGRVDILNTWKTKFQSI